MKYLRLLRVTQWYKNLVIFIPLVFAEKLFVPELFIMEIIGFLALCFVSSSNYIINDIMDAEKDKLHSYKKNRPIASGKISKGTAWVISITLFAASLIISFSINWLFLLWPIMLFISTQIYSWKLKNVPILDIHMIALNFLIRTTAGSVAIGVQTSVWLFLLAFLLAIFLALGKRRVELSNLGKKAEKHRPVFKFYTKDLLDSLINIVIAVLLASYAFYTFLANTANDMMMITIPIATFILFRYLFLIKSDSRIANRTELIIYDKQLTIGIIVWTLVSVYIFYVF